MAISGFRRMIFGALLVVLIGVGAAPLFSQSLGDVAREQRETQKKKSGYTTKPTILTNDDLNPDGLAVASGNQDAVPTRTSSIEPESQAHAGNDQTAAPVGSVLDRPKKSEPDVIVIPAGTGLRVDLDDHKTVVPVRVGFATPIPALSKVNVELTNAYFTPPYSYPGETFCRAVVRRLYSIRDGYRDYGGRRNIPDSHRFGAASERGDERGGDFYPRGALEDSALTVVSVS